MGAAGRTYSPEFKLILWILAAQETPPPANAFDVDWREFFKLAQRHRVSGLLANLLFDRRDKGELKAHIPPEILSNLAAVQRRSLANEMAGLIEAKNILKLLEVSGLSPVLLKGLALSHAAFGKIGWRNNYDTDILITPEDITTADKILREANYTRFEPTEKIHDQAWADWRRRRKDAAYRNDKTGSVVELHWRLFDNPAILSGPVSSERTRLLGNIECRTLEAGLNFAYVCCHGSQHAFSRLKWLADVYFLARRKSASELVALFQTTADPCARAAMAQALALCGNLFGLALDDAVINAGGLKRRNIRIAVWMAEKTLTRGGSREIESLPFGATLKTLSHYLMSVDPRYLAQEAWFDMREKFHGRTTI
ncbi:nucleotidyltransferase family protein [Hyphococcus sp.]|uniref:nucleotidyltransferase family protein n=1 Tax=Hyphococcus sp. TaxID=2038636 RepID=UPI0035C75761